MDVSLKSTKCNSLSKDMEAKVIKSMQATIINANFHDVADLRVKKKILSLCYRL